MDGLEKRYGSNLLVVRLDFLGRVGRAAARHYGVWMIPALVLVDGNGNLVERQVLLVDPASISRRLEQIV